jgi:uracil-DNA glycosylase
MKSVTAGLTRDWVAFIKSSKYFAECIGSIDLSTCCPAPELILQPMRTCPVREVRVVLIGQDPYSNREQASGLAFSILPGGKLTGSMKNILAAVGDNSTSDLTHWSTQGVFMMNAQWTTEPKKAKAHPFWTNFSIEVIKYLIGRGVEAFILFGLEAQALADKCDIPQSHRYEWGHPSPQTRANQFDSPDNFKNCDVFRRFNEDNPTEQILWQRCDRVDIFTDGGCSGNGTANAAASYAYAVVIATSPPVFEPVFQHFAVVVGDKITNNIAELTAIKWAIRRAKKMGVSSVRVISDSQYSINCITVWGPNWRKKGITDKENMDLIYSIIDMVGADDYPVVEFMHVRGHQSGDDYFAKGNNFVDGLCDFRLDPRVRASSAGYV